MVALAILAPVTTPTTERPRKAAVERRAAWLLRTRMRGRSPTKYDRYLCNNTVLRRLSIENSHHQSSCRSQVCSHES